jgi:hypothetical protein
MVCRNKNENFTQTIVKLDLAFISNQMEYEYEK